jgi:hypothetical protein
VPLACCALLSGDSLPTGVEDVPWQACLENTQWFDGDRKPLWKKQNLVWGAVLTRVEKDSRAEMPAAVKPAAKSKQTELGPNIPRKKVRPARGACVRPPSAFHLI